MKDLWFAIGHHLLVFGLMAQLAGEFVLVRPGMDARTVRRVAGLDMGFGVTAVLILLVGFARAGMAAKGWDYYSHNAFFWAKVATFGVIGVLSIAPTLAFIRWRKAGTAPDDAAIAGVRRFLVAEFALFFLLPVFAALMARGYGAL